MATKGVVIFRGDNGSPPNNYVKTIIDQVTDDAALAILAPILGGHSDCNVAKRAFSTLTAIADAEPGADANVDRKAICYFKDTVTQHVISVTIPAPKDTSVEMTAEGERVTDAAMLAIEAALETATGRTLASLYGVVVQKR
jgi:hypothetical protein